MAGAIQQFEIIEQGSAGPPPVAGPLIATAIVAVTGQEAVQTAQDFLSRPERGVLDPSPSAEHKSASLN